MSDREDSYDYFETLAASLSRKTAKLRSLVLSKLILSFKSGATVSDASSMAAYFSKRYKKIMKQAQGDYDKAIKEILKSSDINSLTSRQISQITAKKSIMLDDMSVIDGRMRRDIKKALISVILNDESATESLKKLNKIYPNFSANNKTVLNTYLQRSYRQINFDNQKGIGYPYYEYQGPLDSITRDYCRAHVGKTYTAKQAEGIQATMDTFYNCRHELVGVWEK